MKEEFYPYDEMTDIMSGLISAQAKIEKMAGVTDIFQIRESNPQLFHFYMSINQACCDGFDLIKELKDK